MKFLKCLLASLFLVVFTSCAQETIEQTQNIESNETSDNKDLSESSLAGEYTGVSWKGEAKGVTFDEATEYIKTIITLDDEGVITSVDMDFMVYKNDEWISRLNPQYSAIVDFSIEPTIALAQSDSSDYQAGNSMFKITNNDKMANVVVAVDKDGTVAFGIVDPFTRYLQEYKLESSFDFTTSMKDLTIASGLMVPTTRTSTSGMIKPTSWDDYQDASLFDFYSINNSITGSGVFEGLSDESSVQEYLERLGVSFVDNKAQEMPVVATYYGLGGWSGNYEAIEQYLVNKSATEVTSLIDWSIEKYAGAVNENNIFGIDVSAGATKTVQNSIDGVSGATVRVSRESTSYQRALVEAGLLDESEVIIGRF